MIAKKAYADHSTLKEAALALGYLTEEEFDRAVGSQKDDPIRVMLEGVVVKFNFLIAST